MTRRGPHVPRRFQALGLEAEISLRPIVATDQFGSAKAMKAAAIAFPHIPKLKKAPIPETSIERLQAQMRHLEIAARHSRIRDSRRGRRRLGHR